MISIVTHSQGGVLASYVVQEKLSFCLHDSYPGDCHSRQPLAGNELVGAEALRTASGRKNGDKAWTRHMTCSPAAPSFSGSTIRIAVSQNRAAGVQVHGSIEGVRDQTSCGVVEAKIDED